MQPSSAFLAWLFVRAVLAPHEPAAVTVANSPLPTARSAYAWLETTSPQIISSEFDAGGLLVGRAPKIGVHGTSATDTTFRVNGLDITSALRPGTPIVMPDMAATATLSVTRMPSDITANTPGPLVEWQPVDGRERVGLIEGFFMPSKFSITPSPTGAQPIAELRGLTDGSMLLAGAIQPGRTSAALGVHWSANDQINRTARSGRLVQPATAEFHTSQFSANAHLAFTPTDHDRTVFSGMYQRAQVSSDTQCVTLIATDTCPEPTRAGGDADTAGAVQMTSGHGATGASELRFALGYQWMQVGARAPYDLLAIDSALDGAVFPRVFSPDGKEHVIRSSLQFRKPVSVAGATHRLDVGASIDASSMTPQLASVKNVYESVNGTPARIWRIDVPGTAPHWTQRTFAAFAADRLGSDTIWLEGGVRIERLTGDNGGATKIAWTNVYPHLAAEAFDAKTGVGLFATYTRAGARLPAMALAWGDVNAPTARVYRWGGADQNIVPALIARVGPGAANGLTKISPDLVRPTYDIAIGGIRVEKARFAAAVSAVVRRADQEIRAVADDPSFYTVVTQPDPNANFTDASDDQQLAAYNRRPETFGLDTYTLLNPTTPGANMIYALDVTAQFRSRHATLAFSAAAVAAKGTAASRGFRVDENDPMLIGGAFGNPNASVNAPDGRTFFDRGYVGKIVGVFALPARISLGVVTRYQDGQPFSRLAIFENLNQGPEAVMAYRNGRPTRFTYISTTDVRLQKTSAFGSKQLTLIVDGFNVFNIGREVSEYVIGDGNFRQTSLIEPPRTIRIGLRIAF